MQLVVEKKKLTITLLVCCALAGFWWLAVHYLNREYFTSALTEKVRQEATAQLGRPVELSRLKLNLRGGVEAENVRIGKLPGEKQDMLAAKKLTVRVNLLKALHAGDLAGVISQVELVSPRLWLGQGQDGKWNVAQFMEQEGPAGKAVFHGKLLVRDGQIIIAAQGRPQEDIRLTRGQVAFAKMPHLAVKLTGAWEQFPLEIRGTYDLERKESDLSGRTGEVSIVELLDAIAHRGYDLYWGKINGGRARLDFRLWDSRLSGAFNLFGGKTQFMIGGQIIAGHWQPPGWHRPVQRLDGHFRWDTSSKELVLSGVKAQLAQTQAQGEGSIIFGASPLFDVKVKAQGQVAEVFDVYPAWRPEGLDADGLANADFSLKGTAQALRIVGSADLQGGRVFHPSLGSPVEGIRGRVTLEPNQVTVRQLSCQWFGGSFTVEEGYLTSPLSVPKGRATVAMHSFQLPKGGLSAQEGKATVRFDNNRLSFEDLSLTMAGGRIEGFALLDLKGPQSLWQTQLSLSELDLAKIEELVREQYPKVPSLNGEVSGTIVAKGQGFTSETIQASAQLALGPTSAGEISFSGAEANVLYNGDYLQLGYLKLQQAGGTLSVAGSLDPHSLALSVIGEDLPLEPWTKLALPTEKIGGKLNLVGQIQGSAHNPKLALQLELLEGLVRGQKIQRAQGKLSYEDGLLSTPDLTVRSQGAIHRLQGSLTTGKEKSVDLNWQIQEESLERVLKLAGVRQPITGRASGQIQLTGTLPKVQAAGMISVLDGKVAKQAFSRGSFFFQSQDDDLVLERAIIEQNGSRLAARGTIGGDGSLNLMIIAPELNLAALTFIPQEQLEKLQGKVSFQGLVGGKITKPTVIGELECKRLEYGQYVFEDLDGRINFEDNKLALTAFKLQWLGAKLVATGQMLLEKDPSVDLQVQLTGAPLGEAVALGGWEDGKKTLAGYLDGMAQITGPLAELQGDGFFSLRGGKIGKLPVSGRGELVLSAGSLELRAVSLKQGQGTLRANGLITTVGLSLKVEGDGLDLAIASELIGERIPPLAGKFSVDAEIVGNYARPKIIAQVAARNTQMGELKLGQVDAQFQLEEGIVQIEKLQAKQNGGSLSLSGVLPLSAGEAKAMGISQAAQAGIQTDLQLYMDRIDLRLFSALNPNLKTLSGLVSAQLKLLGDPNKPELHGRVDVAGGAYSHPLLGGDLEHVNAALVFYGNQMVVEELQGTLGGGSIKITGGVKLEGIKPQSYDLALVAQDVRYNDQKMLDSLLDCKLRLTGSFGLPKVSGTVEVSKTRINWVQSTQSGKAPFDLLLDIDVITRDQASFKYSNLVDIWFQGQVHVGGTLSNLALSGQVASKRGSFDYMEISFIIDEATAEFFDYRGIMPTVQVKASSQVDRYTIFLNLTGPIEDLDFKLSSTPELSQDQILALLGVTDRIDKILGTATGDSNIEQVVQDELLRFLDTQFKSQFMSGVERTVEDFLGLDEFRLEPNFFARGEKMEIRLGKQLSERAFLSYERTLELRPKETFKLDWRILPSMELKGQWNAQSGSSLSLEAKFRF